MADVIDQANERAEQILQSALAKQSYRPAAPSALWCEDCGERIPEARRVAVPGCDCCVSCQEIREIRGN
ncbi:transcriptional regulator, TraR/DksA family [Azotobacter beijerinckii]|uniref:Transcriptional regulator, TraR/DksA family n=1 Tax=Azotobacter beijerinckii TaxID=170623 RepID=A0A1H6TTW6_9GAMM|nr:TraR/DksA family transcriptional regulator [Azotobacter beijerinckii]SEI82686.1 transcriptional regulator, TraR/DksA family [Azotobacter beijerinckii]